MIGLLSGEVKAVDINAAVIDVHGIGFEVHMPSADLATMHIGMPATVYTYMSVSQDAITLFGFLESSSKQMFLQLLKVSGIGPKVALSLLSTLNASKLAHAISDADVNALVKAPGLGKKTAQKVILELKGSINLDAIDGNESGSSSAEATRNEPVDHARMDVIEGLMSLGWRQQDVQLAVDTVIQERSLETPLAQDLVPEVLRAALNALDQGH
ncbi:Holliday junction ATP-dependent DNA helicase RuvA [Bifidobacterium dolichotidis]|uniref:Holliday junction branch migration complex subunit RuvA n=1 Tax=Bifidobacterium dolichotidis TaxID=2306976 RepID=A0A430FT46_9BIFI|nr:Holliday junction branch migration protein RuvA [Bifidobacterium dolichotidis]RSX56046.1 Holliday junction ATP-dependent DNA helicase RuvA [Bifidobacterium dolichotidis]